MKYAAHLKKRFDNIHLDPEDLLLLESFQISYFPDRVPKKEFAAMLHAYPFIKRFLIIKNPSIENFIESILKEYKTSNDKATIERYCNELVWEIADLIVYNKHPKLYDEKVDFNWTINEIIPEELLRGKIVADVGAGSGRLVFLLAKYAETVYAIEPIGSFRHYIRENAKKMKCKNIFTIDGFLNSIPLPDNSVDVLITSNAIGWNLEEELLEIERVLKPSGEAIHLLRNPDSKTENPFHDIFLSKKWNYTFIDFGAKKGLKIKYSKIIN